MLIPTQSTFRLPAILLFTVVISLASIQQTHGQTPNFYTGGGSSDSWVDPNNWYYGIAPINSHTNPQGGWDDPNFCPLPGIVCYPLTPDPNDDGPNGNNDAMFNTDGTITVIDSSVHAKAYGLRVGVDGASNSLLISGGQLDVGIDPATGEISPNGDGWHFSIGHGFNRDPNATPSPKASVIMTGGFVRTNGLLVSLQFVDENVDPAPDPNGNYNTAPIYGEFVMSGGVVNAHWMNVGQFVADGRAVISGDAQINLASNVPGDPGNGGHLLLNRVWYINQQEIESIGTPHLDISENAIFNIYGSVSDVNPEPTQLDVDHYQEYIDNGWLTADDSTDVPTIYLGDGILKICALDADFDADCDVDSDDLATWESNYGMSSGALKADGDANNDGVVDGLDFLELQIEYGVGINPVVPIVSAAAVPEPTSIGLLVVCGAATSFLRYIRGLGTTACLSIR